MTESNKWIKVRSSQKHGKGVFAKRDIPKGTKIIQYTGKIVSKKEGDRISEIEDKKGIHTVFELNEKQDIVGAIGGGDAKYINYSTKPNCESINYDGEEIWIIATKKIKTGEELGYDYGFKEEHWS